MFNPFAPAETKIYSLYCPSKRQEYSFDTQSEKDSDELNLSPQLINQPTLGSDILAWDDQVTLDSEPENQEETSLSQHIAQKLEKKRTTSRLHSMNLGLKSSYLILPAMAGLYNTRNTIVPFHMGPGPMSREWIRRPIEQRVMLKLPKFGTGFLRGFGISFLSSTLTSVFFSREPKNQSLPNFLVANAVYSGAFGFLVLPDLQTDFSRYKAGFSNSFSLRTKFSIISAVGWTGFCLIWETLRGFVKGPTEIIIDIENVPPDSFT